MILAATIIFIISVLAIIYHHLMYPILLNYFAAGRSPITPLISGPLNKFVFVIPMYNEEAFIKQKIANLAAIDYPRERVEIFLLDDGSTDKTRSIASRVAKKYPDLDVKIISFAMHRGKIAVLNDMIPSIPKQDILFFSDVSANLSPNILQRANGYFNNPKVGAFCAKYLLRDQALAGEKYYWNYQIAIKIKESHLGTPIGYHGSGYAIRRRLWQVLPKNTINDDFVMPLRAIAQGFVGVYDDESFSIENESSSEESDWSRRIRIAMGNVQQVLYLPGLLLPGYGFVSWMFFSGKVLRIMMPWLLISLFISNLALLARSSLFLLPLIAQIVFYSAALLNRFTKTKTTEVITYFVKGHCTVLAGWGRLFLGGAKHPWERSAQRSTNSYVHPFVWFGKWITDKLAAMIGLVLLAVVGPIVAVLIKCSSPGPVFYKQLRVGKSSSKKTNLFYIYKFRTMHHNTGKVSRSLTKKNDPRVFRVGQYLRKTHLDELPQFYNILKGDMSLIGPRPEQPMLYTYLENHIPFYEDRLFDILPGLTGLSQITYGYDPSLEGVRKKVVLDHLYGMYLTKPSIWLKTDIKILIKTLGVVFHRQGQ